MLCDMPLLCATAMQPTPQTAAAAIILCVPRNRWCSRQVADAAANTPNCCCCHHSVCAPQ